MTRPCSPVTVFDKREENFAYMNFLPCTYSEVCHDRNRKLELVAMSVMWRWIASEGLLSSSSCFSSYGSVQSVAVLVNRGRRQCRGGNTGGEYHSRQNQFERFRGVLELISRFEFDFCRCGIFFLNDSIFWCVQSSITHNVAVHVPVLWPVCAHTIPLRMLWCS